MALVAQRLLFPISPIHPLPLPALAVCSAPLSTTTPNSACLPRLRPSALFAVCMPVCLSVCSSVSPQLRVATPAACPLTCLPARAPSAVPCGRTAVPFFFFHLLSSSHSHFLAPSAHTPPFSTLSAPLRPPRPSAPAPFTLRTSHPARSPSFSFSCPASDSPFFFLFFFLFLLPRCHPLVADFAASVCSALATSHHQIQ